MVQKFGGTSVGKFPDKVSEIIAWILFLESLYLDSCDGLSADGAALGQIARDIVRLVTLLELMLSSSQDNEPL